MSLGIYSFRLAVTTKSRRARARATFDYLTTENDIALLTQDTRFIELEQSFSTTVPENHSIS
jgi:hypothetical protein